MDFLGLDLSDIPNKRGIVLLWSPILAGLSSLYMCVVQNRSNVLQAEQSRLNRYGVLAFSVGLSL
jgi:YidC/Oxa1 family membrane protein insertase